MGDAADQPPHRIVLTGGTGGRKTTAADWMNPEVDDLIVIVPEAATMLFSGGFPPHSGITCKTFRPESDLSFSVKTRGHLLAPLS